jgi:uncharacterized LabA/DUF88 family protein
MEAWYAFLEPVNRMLLEGFGAAPVAWVLGALALLVATAIVSFRRGRPASQTEVQRAFLASAAATRKAREISEIDAFARRAGAAADDLKAQLRRLRTGHYTQVKVYVDHSNFIKTWNVAVHGRDRPLEHDIDWKMLPEVLLEETGDWLTKVRRASQALVYRGMHVYGTLFEESYFTLLETMLRLEQTAPSKLPLQIRLRKETVDRWREENEAHKVELTQEIRNVLGCVMVPIYRRTPREDQLGSAQYTAGGIPIAPEKMLDTYIATDLIGDATFDSYDVALLVSEDSDFIPAVEFVQGMRTKQVVHVGFGGHTNDLRAACRHRIDLAKAGRFQSLRRRKPAERPPADQARAAD